MAYKHIPARPIDTTLIWAATAAADRVNQGQYVKEGNLHLFTVCNGIGEVIYPVTYYKETNKALFRKFLSGDLAITQADVDTGKELRAFIQTLTLKLLAGTINSFQHGALMLAEKTEWFNREALALGTVVYMPELVRKEKARNEFEQEVAFSASAHIGKIGERVAFEGTVVKSVFSEQWGTYYSTVKTTEGNFCWFAFKKHLEADTAHKFVGTVKRHADEGQTQFNRVKIC